MASQWVHRRVRLLWGRLSVYTTGEGPPLLLLHGLGGSGRYWAGIAELAKQRSIIAPDLAGFGRSDKPDVDYSRDFHVGTIAGLLDELAVAGSLDVAGHSMGGILAALFAARHAARVSSLALVATPFPRKQLRPYGMPKGAVRLALYRGVQRLVPALSPLVRSTVFPRAVIADYMRHTVDSYQRTSNALLWDPTTGDEFTTLAAALAGRGQLLLYSGEDRTIAPDNLERWRATLPEAEVKLIPGAHQLLLRDRFVTLAGWYANEAGRLTA